MDRSTTFAARRPFRGGTQPGSGKPSLRRFDLKTREEETLAEGIDGFKLSADHKKILYHAGEPGEDGPPGGPSQGAIVWGVVDAGKFTKGDGALKLEAVSVPVEPRAESAQIFREAWRINRDYFYATQHARGRLERHADQVRAAPSSSGEP